MQHLSYGYTLRFLYIFLQTIPQRRTTFFWHRVHTVFFPLVSADDSEEGEKLSLSKSIFWAVFRSSVWNVDAALSDSGCSTPNIYAHYCDCTWTSCPFSAKTCGEKIAAKAQRRSPINFNTICFFCGIVCRYLREKIATCNPSRMLILY